MAQRRLYALRKDGENHGWSKENIGSIRLKSGKVISMPNYNEEDYTYCHSKCHPESPTWTKMTEAKIIVECAVCEKTVIEFGKI